MGPVLEHFTTIHTREMLDASRLICKWEWSLTFLSILLLTSHVSDSLPGAGEILSVVLTPTTKSETVCLVQMSTGRVKICNQFVEWKKMLPVIAL